MSGHIAHQTLPLRRVLPTHMKPLILPPLVFALEQPFIVGWIDCLGTMAFEMRQFQGRHILPSFLPISPRLPILSFLKNRIESQLPLKGCLGLALLLGLGMLSTYLFWVLVLCEPDIA